MPRARYHLLDVFTDRPFTGNPLAVFVDPPVLTTPQMQTLAGELHLSETVFVRSPGDGPAWPTRIFTPGAELPFAGHPTIGTAVLLAELGRATDRVVLAEPVGEVDVTIEPRPGGRAATLRTAGTTTTCCTKAAGTPPATPITRSSSPAASAARSGAGPAPWRPDPEADQAVRWLGSSSRPAPRPSLRSPSRGTTGRPRGVSYASARDVGAALGGPDRRSGAG